MKRFQAKLNDWMIAKNAVIAESAKLRLIGLMGRERMDEFDGMLLNPCNSIHTFFMRFAIDVVFLNKNFEVIRVIENLPPWRATRPYFRASQVLELAAGTLAGRLNAGDRLEITYV